MNDWWKYLFGHKPAAGLSMILANENISCSGYYLQSDIVARQIKCYGVYKRDVFCKKAYFNVKIYKII